MSPVCVLEAPWPGSATVKGLSPRCGSLAASSIWPMERDLRRWAVSAYVYAGGVCSELRKNGVEMGDESKKKHSGGEQRKSVMLEKTLGGIASRHAGQAFGDRLCQRESAGGSR